MGIPSESKQWTVAYRQWQGARPYQEDSFAVVETISPEPEVPPGVLLVLADGMGGEAGGAEASRVVVEAYTGRLPKSSELVGLRFDECLEEASSRLRDIVEENPELMGMGSTLVAVFYDGKELAWLSVGDSPMWLFSEGKLERLNADHSMAQILDRLVESGELTAEDALNDNRRHMLLSAVTGMQVDHIDRAKRPCHLKSDNYLLIASDGIQTLSDDDIEQLLAQALGNAEMAAEALLSAVYDNAGPKQDNITFMLLSGRDFRDGQAGVKVDQGTTVANPVKPLKAIFRSIGKSWTGIGLGLIIGLLVVTLCLWWFKESSSEITTPALDAPSAASRQVEEEVTGPIQVPIVRGPPIGRVTSRKKCSSASSCDGRFGW